MATFTFFHEFKKYLGDGTIDLDTHTFKVYLSNAAPTVATHSVKADLAGITVQNGYDEITLTAGWTETAGGSGVWRFAHNADNIAWTASVGSFGPFQYVLLYDDTPSGTPTDPLVGYWDVGAATTITVGNTFTVDLDASFSFFTLT